MNDEADVLRRQLVGVLKSRALAYAAIYDEVAAELGDAAKAEALMKRAIYARGAAMGKGLAKFAPDDVGGLCDAFLAVLPDEGKPFRPEVSERAADAVTIRFHACPTKEAWLEAGFPPERVATLCRIAGAIDNGTFESAGFALDATTWRPGEQGCCVLRISRRAPTPA